MAEQITLEVQPRTVIGKKVSALRRANLVPAVIYGAGGAPVHVSCPYRPLEITLKKAGGTNLINVVVDGQIHNALVREVQRDQVKRTILHVDFLRVDLTKKLRTEVRITLVGEPKLTSELQIAQNMQSLEVECLPTDIPDNIVVDINNLTRLGAQITVGDLTGYAEKGVTFTGDPHEVIVRIEALAAATPEEVAAETAAATAVTAEPEVLEKGKKEEEDF